jgi:CheY-like chemotaxis protein
MVVSRVLIVDDYEPWRRYVDVALRRNKRWHPVGEATDGLDAVRQARLLRPDLILLDIGLPKQNGIDAARRILSENPHAKILFLSEHQSAELVEAALATGASGYIVKSSAGAELLPAMSAIARGERFISAILGGRNIHTSTKKLVQHLPCRHAAGFYVDETGMLDDFAVFAERMLKEGTTLLVLGIASRRHKLERVLRQRGVDVDRLTAEGRYRWLDVAEALSNFMVDEWPDEARFSALVRDVFEEAAASSTARDRRVVAWGECAPTLLRQGKTEAAIRVEELWDRWSARYGVETLCGYLPDSAQPCDPNDPSTQQLVTIHSKVTFQ